MPLGRDVTVNLETSTTLAGGGPGGWTVIATKTGNGPWSGSASVVTSASGPGLETVTVTNPSGETMRYYRLQMDAIP